MFGKDKVFDLATAVAEVRERRRPHEQRRARILNRDSQFQRQRYANGGVVESSVSDEAAVELHKEAEAIARIGREVFERSDIDAEIKARVEVLAGRYYAAVEAADDLRALIHQRATLARECGVHPPSLPAVPEALGRWVFEDWRGRTARAVDPRPAVMPRPRQPIPTPDFSAV
jgi:hypothetical protein